MMTGPGPDRPKSMAVHESINGPINHRDASNSSGSIWKQHATPISVPAVDGRSKRSRLNKNPFEFKNTLGGTEPRTPGNPNVKKTLLATFPVDSHTRKRQKLDANNLSGLTLHGASPEYRRRPTLRDNVPQPDILIVEPSRATHDPSNLVPNNAEIIEIGTSSDDLGERIPRARKSSSPDEILLTGTETVKSFRAGDDETHPCSIHPFDTHSRELSLHASNKGKGRAKEPSELVVEDSESSEEIDEFTPPAPMRRPSSTKKSPDIPGGIVLDRKQFYDKKTALASAPAAMRHPTDKTRQVDLISGSVVRHMKKKDEGAHCNQRGTSVSDRVGTSSSKFLNSPREKEKILPLEAWCLGHHPFRHSESAPLELAYEFAQQKIKVILGQSPPQTIDFKLDRDICSAIIVNDDAGPLGENVVVQFITTHGQEWKKIERKYKGFKGGGDRGKEALTFLFSTAKDRGFSATDYQTFVLEIKRAFKKSAVEVIGPPKGRSIWEFASRLAEMFEQTESRKGMEYCGESTVDKPPVVARSVTPCSSISVKTRVSCTESRIQSRDSGPSAPHRRSVKQSAIRSSRISSPAPPSVLLEPDEVILMYPPTGTGALSIMHSDLRRLQPEEYLNDTLIEFGLKLWLNDLRGKDPTLADQIHVFSSFFYKKLNNKKNPEDGYKSVRKWTSKVDLFSKKYVIVPINENIHWYLAVIYEPGHALEPPLPASHSLNVRVTRKRKQTQEPAESETAIAPEGALAKVSRERSHISAQDLEGEPEVDTSTFSVDATRATTPSTTMSEDMVIEKPYPITVGSEPVPATSSEIQIPLDSSQNLTYPGSDNIDVDGDIFMTDGVPNLTCESAGISDISTSKPLSGIPTLQFYGFDTKAREAGPVVMADNEDSGEDQQQEAEVDDMLAITQSSIGDWPTHTYIFTFDSLGTRHPQAIRVLKQYLAWEAKDKRNFDEVRDAIGKQVQVPVQPNTSDCGIYLLHFVKILMSAPSDFLDQIISTRGTMSSTERKKMWQDHEIPQYRDYLKSRIMHLSEEWKVEKTREDTKNRRSGGAMEVEEQSSESEVDIVEGAPSFKPTPHPKQRRRATRLRG